MKQVEKTSFLHQTVVCFKVMSLTVRKSSSKPNDFLNSTHRISSNLVSKSFEKSSNTSTAVSLWSIFTQISLIIFSNIRLSTVVGVTETQTEVLKANTTGLRENWYFGGQHQKKRIKQIRRSTNFTSKGTILESFLQVGNIGRWAKDA